MDSEDPVVDVAAIEQYLRGYAGRSKLRHTLGNTEEKLRILIALIVAADSRPEFDFMVGEEHLHDFALREASIIEEALVYGQKTNPSVCHLLNNLASFVVEYIDHRNNDHNQRLRAAYKRKGLHGMFKARTVADISANDHLCLLCCDAEPTNNYSNRCQHDPIGCPACLSKLDKCPVCMVC
jgi:hypothetical protein